MFQQLHLPQRRPISMYLPLPFVSFSYAACTPNHRKRIFKRALTRIVFLSPDVRDKLYSHALPTKKLSRVLMCYYPKLWNIFTLSFSQVLVFGLVSQKKARIVKTFLPELGNFYSILQPKNFALWWWTEKGIERKRRMDLLQWRNVMKHDEWER